jgi:hypothetical protein
MKGEYHRDGQILELILLWTMLLNLTDAVYARRYIFFIFYFRQCSLFELILYMYVYKDACM